MSNNPAPTTKGKRTKRKELKDFHLIKGTPGVILDGIWIRKDGLEIIIRSSFWGDKYLHFRPLGETEVSL